ncbi:hypothetical protein CEXT_71701 [Caerostris extrusa]|uniref:Uncharacterized protein n=1 Tax=Caerostris extrusa TaxID=172846 RepID=A0AAV4NW88_CAEEX|nr:hypothetical protein CEXT_71701 [Caerostris extrusa]
MHPSLPTRAVIVSDARGRESNPEGCNLGDQWESSGDTPVTHPVLRTGRPRCRSSKNLWSEDTAIVCSDLFGRKL